MKNTITVYKMHMSRAYEYLPEGGQYWWSVEDQSRCDANYEASVMETRLVVLPSGYFVGKTRDGESAIFSDVDNLRVEIGGKDHPHIIGRNGERIGLREE